MLDLSSKWHVNPCGSFCYIPKGANSIFIRADLFSEQRHFFFYIELSLWSRILFYFRYASIFAMVINVFLCAQKSLICLARSVLTSRALTFTTLWANSADDNWWYFSYFSQKTGFDISCKLSPMETICMKCQNCFLEKIRKQDCLQWRQIAWNVKLVFWEKMRKIYQYVVWWKFNPEC